MATITIETDSGIITKVVRPTRQMNLLQLINKAVRDAETDKINKSVQDSIKIIFKGE